MLHSCTTAYQAGSHKLTTSQVIWLSGVFYARKSHAKPLNPAIFVPNYPEISLENAHRFTQYPDILSSLKSIRQRDVACKPRLTMTS